MSKKKETNEELDEAKREGPEGVESIEGMESREEASEIAENTDQKEAEAEQVDSENTEAENAEAENAEAENAEAENAKAENAKAENAEAENAEAEKSGLEKDGSKKNGSEKNEPGKAEAEKAEPENVELTDEQVESIFEAILFTMGETVEIRKLAEVAGIDLRRAKKILQKMEEQYQEQNRGIMLTQFDSAVQLCTKPETYEYLIKIAKTPKKLSLTDTVIETLSIIAYKQPVTRLDVENIRGVNCDHAINKLLEYDLITELGRLDAPGRPILFGTTEQFLRSFGVKSLEELPELSTVQIEEFKAQAEEEIKLKLD